MKKILFIMIGIVIIFGYVYAKHIWKGEVLPPAVVLEKWGKSDFDIEKFKANKPGDRLKMAYSMVTSKKFNGRTPLDVKKELGPPSGYYFSDSYLTYLLPETKPNENEIWQIVFLLNKERNISEVVVHKNCCYK